MKGLSFLSSLTEGVSRLTTEATKAKEKFLDGQTQAEQISFTSLWEAPEPVDNCRECAVKFQLVKHHCRSCAGVFCDDCCQATIPNAFERNLLPPSLNVAPGESVRICLGCRRGECPSRVIKEKVRHLLDNEASGATARTTRIEKFSTRVGAKLGEAVNQLGDGSASGRGASSARPTPGAAALAEASGVLAAIPLKRGSYYGENNMMKKSGTKPLAILRNGDCYSKFEIPRPSYIAIPPNEAVYTFFNPDLDQLAIIVLFKNANSIPSNTALIYDTKAPGSNPSRITNCARIDLMEKVQVYNADSIGKNVLLKYKGNGIIFPREGTSVDRVGVFGYFQGRRFTEGMLDYQTNVDRVNIAYAIN